MLQIAAISPSCSGQLLWLHWHRINWSYELNLWHLWVSFIQGLHLKWLQLLCVICMICEQPALVCHGLNVSKQKSTMRVSTWLWVSFTLTLCPGISTSPTGFKCTNTIFIFGKYLKCKQAIKQTNTRVRNAVSLVWDSLRLMKIYQKAHRKCTHKVTNMYQNMKWMYVPSFFQHYVSLLSLWIWIRS